MPDAGQIKLSEISKRFLFRYYPFWLLFAVTSYVFIKAIKWGPDQGIMESFFRYNLYVLILYMHLILPLYIFKPVNPFFRIIVVMVSMLLGIMALTVYTSRFGRYFDPVPFIYSPVPTIVFLSYTSIGICVIWFYFLEERQYISEKRIRAERDIRILNEKKLMESQLRLLQAQIEPHFLFNTLTSIVSLDDTDPQKAKTMQMNLIQYLKATLDKTRAGATTIGQEIELICAYLEIFKVRMGERLKYAIDVEKGMEALPFPSMLIQPIIENAIKHGLEPKVEGGEIYIRVTKNGNKLCWEISDTGLGLSEAADFGTGLSSIIERIDSLYGGDGQVIMEENRPCGLKLVVEVPYV